MKARLENFTLFSRDRERVCGRRWRELLAIVLYLYLHALIDAFKFNTVRLKPTIWSTLDFPVKIYLVYA